MTAVATATVILLVSSIVICCQCRYRVKMSESVHPLTSHSELQAIIIGYWQSVPIYESMQTLNLARLSSSCIVIIRTLSQYKAAHACVILASQFV